MKVARPPKLAPLALEACRPDVAEMIVAARAATGGAQNIFLTMARHPSLFKRYVGFSGKLLWRGALPPVDRELAILRTAHRCDSHYEWIQHERIGRNVGIDDASIERVRTDDTAGWQAHEVALLKAVDELIGDHRVSDATWNVLATHYDETQLVELLLLIGNYVLVAGFLNTLEVEVEDRFLEASSDDGG